MSSTEDGTVSTVGEAQAMGLEPSELGVLASVRVRKSLRKVCVRVEASH